MTKRHPQSACDRRYPVRRRTLWILQRRQAHALDDRASVKKTTGVPADQSLVQNAIAAYAVGHRRIDLLKFGLQLLVDQQQCFQRAADVTVATGHNLVDGGFFWFRSHRKSFNFPRAINSWRPTAFLWIMWIRSDDTVLIERTRYMAKVPIVFI